MSHSSTTAPGLTGRHARRLATLAAAVALVFAAACGADGSGGTASGGSGATAPEAVDGQPAALPTPVQELEIVGDDYTFAITPDPAAGLRPGWTTVRFRNVGQEAHQVMFARIKEGVDLSELAAAGAGDSSGAGAIEFVDMIGGVSYIGPGQEITAMVDLPEGMVMAMCYVPDANGVAHALMGMTTMLNVSAGAPEPAPVTVAGAPGGDVVGTIELAPEGYVLPDPLVQGWYRVVNTDVGVEGRGLHELSIMRLGEPLDGDGLDALLEAIATNATPAVPLEALGGMGAISPGFEGYLYLDLPAGDYLAVDFMPDARDPRPHLLDGYHASFSV